MPDQPTTDTTTRGDVPLESESSVSLAAEAVKNGTATETTYSDGSKSVYSFVFSTWLVFEPKGAK